MRYANVNRWESQIIRNTKKGQQKIGRNSDKQHASIKTEKTMGGKVL